MTKCPHCPHDLEIDHLEQRHQPIGMRRPFMYRYTCNKHPCPCIWYLGNQAQFPR